MSARIRLDATQHSVVVRCADCPWWYGFAADRVEGWTVARRHEEAQHPGSKQALSALRHAEQR